MFITLVVIFTCTIIVNALILQETGITVYVSGNVAHTNITIVSGTSNSIQGFIFDQPPGPIYGKYALKLNPNNLILYVSTSHVGFHSIMIINVTTNTLLSYYNTTIPAGSGGSDLVLSPDGSVGYLAAESHLVVMNITNNGATLTTFTKISLGSTLSCLFLTSDNIVLYVGDGYSSSNVYAINVTTLQLIGTINLGTGNQATGTFAGVSNANFSTPIYISWECDSCAETGGISGISEIIYSQSTPLAIYTLPNGAITEFVGMTVDNQYIYLPVMYCCYGNAFTNYVLVLNTSFNILNNITVGLIATSGPVGIGFSPDNKNAYVANTADGFGTLTVINVTSQRVITTITGFWGPDIVAVLQTVP